MYFALVKGGTYYSEGSLFSDCEVSESESEFHLFEPHMISDCKMWIGRPLLKALPHVTISSTISSTFHRRRWNIVDIVDDEPATRNDNVNDADVK